tara:strand:+ start:133676 stop:136198 length:2523 start_codon:yes stop_codon:yes gene_type:complete
MSDYKGVDTSKEQVHRELKKDLTPTSIKIKNYIRSDGAWLVLVAALLLTSVIPQFSIFIEIMIIITFIIFLVNIKSEEKLPFKKRESSFEKTDLNELHPATNKPMAPQGITFFGNEQKTNKEVWFTNSDVRTHCLIFGTTGAGKTETMLSICVNSLNQASGFIYVDGKADNELFAKIFSLAACRGRLDDLYLVNFMTAHMSGYNKTLEKSSHKMNPCATSSANVLSELFTSLLPDGSGDGMWKGRASIFISSLLRPLVYLRDQGKLLLDVDTIRRYFELKKVIELSQNEEIPQQYRDGIQQYVINLPGFTEPTEEDPEPEQQETVGEQHGYITMQFTEMFGLLSDDYGHIMKTQVAEVDFFDIVLNRRILVVLLPALEKSEQNVRNLGKIIVTSIKNMMSATLGSRIEGSVKDTIEMKATKSRSPYMTIFDEYGYYAVPGAAVMPAQARSLGFFMIFAGQDYQAFQKGSKEDVGSIIANCAIKICMKLEDPKETLEVFQKAAGEGIEISQQSFERKKDSSMGGYRSGDSVSVQKKDIINVQDLRNQNAGEAHMLFRSETRRIKHFYAEPKLMKHVVLNTFLEVEPLEYKVAKYYRSGSKLIERKFKEIQENYVEHKSNIKQILNIVKGESEELENVFKFIRKTRTLPVEIRSVFSIAGYVKRISIIDSKIVTEIRENIERFNSENYDPEDTEKESFEDENEIFDEEVDYDKEYEEINEEDDYEKETTSNLIKLLEESIKQKSSTLDEEQDKEDLFKSLDLNILDLKESLSEMDKDINNKMLINGAEKEREKATNEYNDKVADNTILDITNELKPSKQKNPDDEELDAIINDILDNDLNDI